MLHFAAMRISVVVQSVEGRTVWERMRNAVEATDIGTNYERMVHPAGMRIDTFFLSTLERLAQADTELVLRFEDDVVFLNDHIAYNAITWPALNDPRFGVGWLLASGGATASFVDRYIYGQYGQDVWSTEFTHCSSACLFWRKDLPAIIEGCREWFEKNPGCERQLDRALCAAVVRMQREICLHAPSLVDHDASVESTLGHGMTHSVLHTACGTFRKEWRRE